MATGVATVWLPVSDMQRALGFYRDTLGLTVKSEDEVWSEIDADGLMIGLNGREETSGRGTPGGAVISFRPDGGIEDEVDRLKQAGVDFAGPVSDHEWGRIAAFHDSEGNALQLYAPPSGG